MLVNFYGIIKRAWYLFFGFFTVIGLINIPIHYLQYNRIKEELIIFTLALPIGWIIHKISHWIIWGKFN